VTCSFPRLFLPHLGPRLVALGASAPWLLPPCGWRCQTSQYLTITMSDLNTARTRGASLAGRRDGPRGQGDISFPGLTALMCLARCGRPPSARG
jgi:hypothetical protein